MERHLQIFYVTFTLTNFRIRLNDAYVLKTIIVNLKVKKKVKLSL
jgi:hypothetical protein